MRSHVANVADSKRPFRYSKIIVTIGVGMNMINLPIYLANCSPPRLRGTAINSYAAVVGECRVIRSLGVLLLTLSFSCNLQLSQLSSPLASFTHCQLTRVISSILFLLVSWVCVFSTTGTLTKEIRDPARDPIVNAFPRNPNHSVPTGKVGPAADLTPPDSCLLFLTCPSPQWLVQQGRTEEALAVLRTLRPAQESDDLVRPELSEMIAATSEMGAKRGTLGDCFRGVQLRRTLACIGIACLFQAQGESQRVACSCRWQQTDWGLTASGLNFLLGYLAVLFVQLSLPNPFQTLVISSSICVEHSKRRSC